MTFPYKHVVIIGATSGIGLSMAARLIREGVKVIAVGRRQDRLEEFVQEHGREMASAVSFNISSINEIAQFANRVITAYPEIDSVFLNAGMQGRYDFSKPEDLDLQGFLAELNINFSSSVALTQAFLPHLMKKPSTSIIFTGANLAIVPASTLPAYSASKAALNAFILCLRDQLRHTSVKIIEVSPPAVQTELHDKTMGIEAGRKLGMPLNQFVDEAYHGLASGKDQIVIGSIGPGTTFNEIIEQRRGLFELLARILRGDQ